jgi:probable HAF family extracellular repeat protein
MKHVFVSSLLAALVLFQPASAHDPDQQPSGSIQETPPLRYKVHDLGAIENGESYARSVSADGKAAGYVTFTISGEKRPALFEIGKLPAPIYTDGPGEATGINAVGQIVGWYLRGDKKQAFLWKNHDLRLLMSPIGGDSVASAVNDRSEIVGWFEALPGIAHAFYAYNGAITDLGSWGGVSAQATSINKHGDIVGFREKVVNGVLVKQGILMLRGQRPEIIRPLPGFDHLVPNAINEKGDVVGYMSPNNTRFPFGAAAFRFSDGKLTRLGPVRDPFVYGYVGLSINKHGQTVGYFFDRLGDPFENAHIWDKQGQESNLAILPEARAAGWYQLTEPNDINNDGVIVGAGAQRPATGGQRTRGFMLVPDGKR